MRYAPMVILGVIFVILPFTTFAGNCADVDSSGAVNILDISYLLNYLYMSGSEPYCGILVFGTCGDVNSSGTIDILDITYLISYLYMGGPEPLFCETSTMADIDGNIYQTIKIGYQWWMMENLKVTHYRNGDPIHYEVYDWIGVNVGAYCYYRNDAGNFDLYGLLYNWTAVNDIRGLAPVGWHIPTDEEWQQLEIYLGMGPDTANDLDFRGTDEGGKLKTTGTTHWLSPNTGATNESGFFAYPSGFRSWYGPWSDSCEYAFFWTSTMYESPDPQLNNPLGRGLDYLRSQIRRTPHHPGFGFSVRCVKD
jgi:uncharacterized protein (TIGR02145 family)